MGAVERSCALAAWASAWLAGRAPLDDVLDIVQGADVPHVVEDNRGGEPGPVDPLAVGLGVLRRAGARALRPVLPAPGDVSGMPGPAAVNQAALAAGSAVLVVGAETPMVMIPQVTAHGPEAEGALVSVRWRLENTAREPVPPLSVRAADLELAAAIRDTTATLLQLDVAGGRGAAVLASGRATVEGVLPPGFPGEAAALLVRAERLVWVLDLAARDEGGAVSAGEVRARADALRGLSAAVRRAREAAYAAAPAAAPATS